MTTPEEGKARREKGMRFERKVRADLEKQGWIVAKWTNNVEFTGKIQIGDNEPINSARLHSARSNRFNMRSTGFPDFIAFRRGDHKKRIIWSEYKLSYEVIAVEVKMNGTLSKVEKEKCSWYLDNNIFSKILIASKGITKNDNIVYKEFERRLKK